MVAYVEFSWNVIFNGPFHGLNIFTGCNSRTVSDPKIWVSTACAGCPHHMFKTTLAVCALPPVKLQVPRECSTSVVQQDRASHDVLALLR